MSTILKVVKLSKAFGGLMALKEISLEAKVGQIVGIIGPNGAGKTTLFNCLTSLYQPSGGEIIFKDLSIIPQISLRKKRLIQRCAYVFFAMGIGWLPVFWSVFLPHTFFKVEVFLLGVFLLIIRSLVARGLVRLQIWAWGIMFVFLASDMLFAIWFFSHFSSLGNLLGTDVPLTYVAVPWSIGAGLFGAYTLWQLVLREVRQLYGFRPGPDAVTRMGVARTFQNIRLFTNLSVLDNAKIGSHAQMRSGIWGAVFRTASQRREEHMSEKKALEHLRFVGLEHRATDMAGALPYGEQRRLEIARALATRPQLLLLDEPAAGMNPQESYRLIQLIRKIRDSGVTVLIIEHDMKVMMNLADIIYVFDYGLLIACGTPDEVKNDPKVIKAYLGGSMAHADA